MCGRRSQGKGGGSWKDRGFRFRGGVKATEVIRDKEARDLGVKLPGVHSHHGRRCCRANGPAGIIAGVCFVHECNIEYITALLTDEQ